MNKGFKLFIKVLVCICILVLMGDLIFVFYAKRKEDDKKIFFESLNSYVVYKDFYFGVGSDNKNKDSYEKAVIMKYNSYHKKVWSRSFSSKYNSTYYSIKRDGKYFLAVGSYEKTKEENKDNLRTALFVKYDQSGNIVFEKDLQVLGNSKFVNVLVLEDGYIVVGQSIYPNDVLGNENTGGALIIKYSKKGKLLWQRNSGGNKSGLFNDVIKSGNYLYAVGKDATRYGLVAKYRLDGECEKVVSYAKTDTLGFSSIVHSDDSFFVVGAKKVKEEDEYNHDTDGLVVEYNHDLEKINETTYQDRKNGIERFNKVILDNKSIIVVGHEAIKDTKNSTKNENVYSYSGIIVQYDLKLKEKASSTYAKDQEDYFTDVENVHGRYVISAYKKYQNNRYLPFFLEYDRNLK